MQADTVQRVRIYLSEKDTISGRPSYLATLETLREAGATGATALRGLAGFGVSQRLATDSGDPGQKLPVVIEWIDRADRVGRILPSLDALLPDALITIEQVQIYRATLRSSGPFGERRVGELAARDVATIGAHRSVADATRLLLLGEQQMLPITDEQQRPIGTFSRADLGRHAQIDPALLSAMPDEERAALLASLELVPLGQVANREMLTLSVDSSVLQATKAMIEWGLDEVPVASREGRFHGVFTIGHALQAAQESRAATDGPIRDAEKPTPIGLLMQGVRQSVLGYALAAEGLERLAAGDAPLVVLDNGRPQGVLDMGVLLAGAAPELRGPLAAFFRSALPRPALAELLGETRVASLPLAPLPSLPTTAGYDEAIALLRERGSDWLAAVDDQGRTQGLVGQRTILRALLQESSA